MVKRNHGYIINIGSTAGCWPYTGGNVYGGTKAFVEQFSRNLRTDLKETAVKVTVLKPGLCGNTEFSNVRFHGDDAKAASVYTDTKSIGPEDIANTVLFLCSEKASFITGENICVDGGMTKLMIYHGEHGWAYSDAN